MILNRVAVFCTLLFFANSCGVISQSTSSKSCLISILDYGAKMDGKSDDSKAIKASLEDLDYAFIPSNEHGATITQSIYLEAFQKIYGAGRASKIISKVSKNEYAIVVSDIKFTEDAQIENLTISVMSQGSNGINILRSRNVFVDNIFIQGNNKCDVGFQIDGGTEKGSAWNQLNKYTITRCNIGINLTSNTPKNFCNRNFIGYGIVQSSNIGVRLYRSNTNTSFANTQACLIGYEFEKSKSNRVNTFIENSKTNSVILKDYSTNNVITGGLNIDTIINESNNNLFNLTAAKQKEFNKKYED